MSKQRKLFLLCCFLLLDVLLVGGVIFIGNSTINNIFNNEVNALVELDFNTNSFDSDIKSYGDYAVVEEAIKSYLNEYAKEVQILNDYCFDSKLNNLILEENIIIDGPNFEKSFNYISAYRDDFNNKIDALIERSTYDDIRSNIYKYSDDPSVINKYFDVIDSKYLDDKVVSMKDKLEILKLSSNNHFDSIYNVLEFLKNNYGTYSYEDGNIKFSSVDLFGQYLELIEKTERIYK